MEKQIDKIYEFLNSNKEDLLFKRPQKNIKLHNFQELHETIEELKNNYYGWFNWDGVSNDLFSEIFSYLDEEDVQKCKKVCKTWKRRFLERDFAKFDEFSKTSVVSKRCLLFFLLFWSSTRDFDGFCVPVFQESEDLEEKDIAKKYDFRRCFMRCRILSKNYLEIQFKQAFFFFDEIDQDENDKYSNVLQSKCSKNLQGIPEILSTIFSNIHKIDKPNSIYLLPLGFFTIIGEIIPQEKLEKGEDIIRNSVFASIKTPDAKNSVIEMDDFIFMEKINDRKIMFDIYCYLLEFNEKPERVLRLLVKISQKS